MTPLESNFRAWPEDPVERAALARTNKQYRSVIIETCCLIHQVWVRLLGISEIRSKYEPIWKESDELSYVCFGNMLFTDIVRNDRIGRFYHIL
ncbi:hypothetical protein V1525DRAFT_409639 [Lipomyces kononenkoae]|uniref:Uncharacterized protein n=1 Tax=Lipomyces kononenkoae TaxID=34357 RepID=A0ACC3SVX8_LIPKO